MHYLIVQVARAVNGLLGKNISSILPARRESDTFPARRGRQEFFPGKTFSPTPGGGNKNFSQKLSFCLTKKKGEGEKRSTWSAAHGGRRKKISQEKQKREIFIKLLQFLPRLLNFMLIYVSHEESVPGTNISKNSRRWLLLRWVAWGWEIYRQLLTEESNWKEQKNSEPVSESFSLYKTCVRCMIGGFFFERSCIAEMERCIWQGYCLLTCSPCLSGQPCQGVFSQSLNSSVVRFFHWHFVEPPSTFIWQYWCFILHRSRRGRFSSDEYSQPSAFFRQSGCP